MPMISIIMAAYNAERFIGEAIGSVQAQTFSDWELIIVDDGSSDKTGEIALEAAHSDPRISLLSQTNSGRPGMARNAGLAVAKGAVVGFLDADDLYAPERLKACVEALRRNPDCTLVFHDFATIDADSVVLRPAVLSELQFLACDRIQREPIDGRAYKLSYGVRSFLVTDYVACWTCAALLRRGALEPNVLRFREDVTIAEDLDLWLRVLQDAPPIFLDRPLAYYRKHGSGITSQGIRFLEDTIRVIETHKPVILENAKPEEAERLTARLRKMHAQVGYMHLLARDGEAARRWFTRGFLRYGGRSNALGVLKSCLPWAGMRALLLSHRREHE